MSSVPTMSMSTGKKKDCSKPSIVQTSSHYAPVPRQPNFWNFSNPIQRLNGGLQQGYMTDVNFLIGPDRQLIPAHKFILALGSKVFDVMFNGSLANPRDKPIEIPDIEPENFQFVLKFIYTNEFPVEMATEKAIDLLYIARKYDLGHLEALLVDFLTQDVRNNNSMKTIISVLVTSQIYDLKELEGMCWTSIDQNTTDLIDSEQFTSIPHKMLCQILQRDSLDIDEISLYEATIKWGEGECTRQNLDPKNPINIRQVLNTAIQLIRFPSMESSEFANGPGIKGILSENEIGNILLFICSTNDPKPEVRNFSPVKRACSTSREDRLPVCPCRQKQLRCNFCYDVKAKNHGGSSIISTTGSSGARKSSDYWKISSSEVFRAIITKQPTVFCACRTRNMCPKKSQNVQRIMSANI